MRNTKEIIHRQSETVEIERPFEPAVTPATGNYPGYRDTSIQEGFQFVFYWRIIRKRFWLVVGIAVLLTTVSAIYMARKPNVYQARAVVQVDLEQMNPELVTTASSRSPLATQDPGYFNTQLQLLWSDSLLRRVVKEYSLDSHKEFQKAKADGESSALRSFLKTIGLTSEPPKKAEGVVDEIATSPGISVATTEEINEAIRLAPYVSMIKKNLDVEPIRETRATSKDTRLIEITYRNTDPDLAAFVVNGIGEVFGKTNQEKRSGNSKETNDFLQTRIAQLQSEIREGEMKLYTLTERAGILAKDGTQTVALGGVDILNRQLLEAENERKLAEAELKAVNDSPDRLSAKTDADVIRYTSERENNTQAVVSDLEKQIIGLNATKTRLLEEYQPTAQEVLEVDKQIAVLEKGIEKARTSSREDLSKYRKDNSANLLNNLKTKYLAAKGREDKLRVAFDEKMKEATDQNRTSVSLNILNQDVATKRGFLTELLNKVRANDVQAAGTDNNINVVEIAIPPETPVAPRRLTTVLGVLFLSTLFGMGLALFLEYLDDTIRTTEEIETYLGLPALAAIPRIDSLPGRRKLLLVGGNEDGESKTSNPTNDLLIHRDSRSSLAESYRQLRTSILLSTAGHAPKSLLITSSLPSEGKTTTAINTAISLAQTGAKVLIIDADMRRPRLHSVFNKSNAEGLSTTLSSDLTEQEILNVIQYDEDSRLNLLPSGPVPPNPAELVGSEQMSALLKTLQNNFTHVVVDSPPIASFTDGVLIASMVDGVILVVNSGRSSRQVVRRSRQLLMDIGAKIFGVVLNNVNLNSSDNSYYYQSYYHRDNYRHDEE